MYDLTFTEETYRVDDIGIVGHPENIVVGQAGFLLWGDLVSTTYTKI